MDFSNIYKQIKDSIVNVIVVNSANTVISTGTGVLVGDGSKILTCSHCINMKEINGIYDPFKSVIEKGIVVFNDSVLDIAILEMSKSYGNGLVIRNSASAEIGNEIFTIGYPYIFPSERTLTAGNIAAFENGLLKIDTSVNNGNSGGPLLNCLGEVVGIVNTKLGRLSKFLESIEQAKPQASIVVGGIDPVKVMQQMIREMARNLNLGIGYAIPTNTIASHSSVIKALMT